VRRTVVLALSTLCALGALQLPAHAAYQKCNTYSQLDFNGTGAEAKVCVNVSGSYRAAYLEGYYNSGSISMTVQSLYLRQCDGTGNNCVVIAQNSGSASGNPTADFFGDWKTVSFGHTYIACASLTINSNFHYTNVCSNFWAN
jgi:hypothetical protein